MKIGEYRDEVRAISIRAGDTLEGVDIDESIIRFEDGVLGLRPLVMIPNEKYAWDWTLLHGESVL